MDVVWAPEVPPSPLQVFNACPTGRRSGRAWGCPKRASMEKDIEAALHALDLKIEGLTDGVINRLGQIRFDDSGQSFMLINLTLGNSLITYHSMGKHIAKSYLQQRDFI